MPNVCKGQHFKHMDHPEWWSLAPRPMVVPGRKPGCTFIPELTNPRTLHVFLYQSDTLDSIISSSTCHQCTTEMNKSHHVDINRPCHWTHYWTYYWILSLNPSLSLVVSVLQLRSKFIDASHPSLIDPWPKSRSIAIPIT